MKIYVGNFSYDDTEDDLKAAFEAFGQVESVKIIKDKYSGESRGFGFVEMINKKEAQAAIDGVRVIKERSVTVNEARPQERREFGGKKRASNRNKNFNRKDRRY